MKAALLTEGGSNTGFGHISRCSALYQAFESKNISVKIFADSEGNLNNLLTGFDYSITDWIKDLPSELKEYDIVIIDSYLAGTEIYKEISKKIKVPAYLDDYIRLNYPAGFVINGSLYADKMPYPRNPDVEYLLGREYILLRKEFREIPERTINKKIKKILITLGGQDNHGILIKLLENFIPAYPEIDFNIVLNENYINFEQTLELRKDNCNYIYNADADGMKELMLTNDIAISAMGQTIHELCRAGLPFIGIQTAKNQYENVLGALENDIINELISWQDNDLLSKINRQFARLSDYDTRVNKVKIEQAAVDGSGAENIVANLINRIE